MPSKLITYWNLNQPKAIRFSYEDSLGGYLLLFKKLLEILKVVLEGNKIIEPEEDLKYRYSWILEYFYSIQTREDFSHIPKIDFEHFASITEIDEKLVTDWKKSKPQYTEYLRIIDREFRATQFPFSQVKVPRNLDLMLPSLEEELIRHQKLANTSTFVRFIPLPKDCYWEQEDNCFYVQGERVYFKGKSERRMVFRMLTDANGDEVLVRKMAAKIRKRDAEVRIIIDQLKDKIRDTSLNIVTARNGAYRLAITSLD